MLKPFKRTMTWIGISLFLVSCHERRQEEKVPALAGADLEATAKLTDGPWQSCNGPDGGLHPLISPLLKAAQTTLIFDQDGSLLTVTTFFKDETCERRITAKDLDEYISATEDANPGLLSQFPEVMETLQWLPLTLKKRSQFKIGLERDSAMIELDIVNESVTIFSSFRIEGRRLTMARICGSKDRELNACEETRGDSVTNRALLGRDRVRIFTLDGM